MESTGALFMTFALYLQMLGRQSRAPGTHDSTVYATARASPKTVYRHHTAAIVCAQPAWCAYADANVLLNAVASASFELTRDAICPPPSPPSPVACKLDGGTDGP